MIQSILLHFISISYPIVTSGEALVDGHLARHGPSILGGSSFEPFTGMQSGSVNCFPQSHLRSFQRSLSYSPSAPAATERDQCVARDVRNKEVSPSGRINGVEGVESASSGDGDAKRSGGCFFRFSPGSLLVYSRSLTECSLFI